MNGKLNDKLTERAEEKGQVTLLIVLIMLSTMLVAGLFVADMIMKQTRAALNVLRSAQAYYATDSGSENVLYEIIHNGKEAEDIPDAIGNVEIGDCSYNAVNVGSENLKVEIIGSCGQARRSIELSY